MNGGTYFGWFELPVIAVVGVLSSWNTIEMAGRVIHFALAVPTAARAEALAPPPPAPQRLVLYPPG